MKQIEFYSELLRERYVKIEHRSGLPIYVFPKKMTGTYALLATRYGSIDSTFRKDPESPWTTVPDGIAHYLEHKLFENEDGSDSFARFSALGAHSNAYTSYDRTAYLFSCTEHFTECLEELFRFVTHPYFTPATVQKERGIIAEEIRMYEDSPWEKGYLQLLQAMYQNNPVRKNICGTEQSIAQITPELLYECYHTFYNLSNMILVVCGDVCAESVVEVADRMLPKTAASNLILRRKTEEPPEVSLSYVCTKMQTSKPVFFIGFKDCVIADPEERIRRDAAFTLLNEILFSHSGDFYSTLFEEGIVAPSFSCSYSCTETFAINCISGEADSPQTVLERLYAYLEQVREEGISEEAYERCRRTLYADEICAYDSTEEIANRLLSFLIDQTEMFSYPQLLESITLDELNALVRETFSKSATTLSVIDPLESASGTGGKR